MHERIRTVSIGLAAVAAASLAACTSTPLYPQGAQYPAATQPVMTGTAPAQNVFGRVTSIEYVPQAQQSSGSSPNVLGAVVGGVAGAVLGRQIGDGSGRTAATVLGGLGGAALGSQVGGGQNPPGATGESPSYRVTVATDQGLTRTYEVSAYGDLRVGDRVRVENGIIYRV